MAAIDEKLIENLRLLAAKEDLPDEALAEDTLLAAARLLERAMSWEDGLRELLTNVAVDSAVAADARSALYPDSVYRIGSGFAPPASLTDLQVRLAQELWADGLDIGQIAESLGLSAYQLSPWIYSAEMQEVRDVIRRQANS